MIESDLVFLHPLGVGLPRSQLLLDLLVRDQALLFGIHQQHAARREPPLHPHVLGLDGEHACFRGHHNQSVVSHEVSARPQAVPVELCADHPPIGKRHRSRTVPRLHQRRMVFIKCFDVLRHGGVVLPRFGDQHRHHVRDAAPRHRQQFHCVVQVRRVAAARRNDRKQPLHVVAEQRRGQHGLPRIHPVHVPAQCVDLSVVADVAVRMRQLPARECIRGEALVHEAQRARHLRIRQLLVEMHDLRSEQQSLVDDRPRRQRRNVEELLLLQVGLRDRCLGLLAQHVKFAFERVLVHAGRPADEDLLDVGLGVARQAPDRVSVDRSVAPPEHGESVFARNPLEDARAEHSLLGIDRQEHHSDPVFARRRQGETKVRAFPVEEEMGNLNQNAGAISRFGIAAAGAPMCKVNQDLDALQYDVVGLLAVDARDESDAATVVLVLRAV